MGVPKILIVKRQPIYVNSVPVRRPHLFETDFNQLCMLNNRQVTSIVRWLSKPYIFRVLLVGRRTGNFIDSKVQL